jgi:hypothetical protein
MKATPARPTKASPAIRNILSPPEMNNNHPDGKHCCRADYTSVSIHFSITWHLCATSYLPFYLKRFIPLYSLWQKGKIGKKVSMENQLMRLR